MDTDRTDTEEHRVRSLLDRSADDVHVESTPAPTGQQQEQEQEHVTGYPDAEHLDPNIGVGVGVGVGVGEGEGEGEGELDLEMDVNIKQALQRVIEGFEHEPGDMSATLQQQEEYMRRGAREQDENEDGGDGVGGGSHDHNHHHQDHLHHHPDDVHDHGHEDHDHDHQDRDHDDIQDVMAAADNDRDNIFQHFAAIDDPHGHVHSHGHGHGHGQDRGETPLHEHGLSSRGMGEDEQAHDQDQDQDPVQAQHQDPSSSSLTSPLTPSAHPTNKPTNPHPHRHPSPSPSHSASNPNPDPSDSKSQPTNNLKRKRPIKIKAPIPPLDDDPSRPLTEEEIKRRQNRSRASGRVLPRGNACEFCKRRKLRCDGERPVCTACIKNKRECVYVQRRPRKKPSKKAGAQVGEEGQSVPIGAIDLTPEIILPDPVDLEGLDQDPIAGPSGTTEHDGEISMNMEGLEEIELPAMDMTVAEGHDGFNALFEQSAAAAEADHGVDSERVHGQAGEGEPTLGYPEEHGLGRTETQMQMQMQDEAGGRTGSMGPMDEQEGGTPGSTSRQTGQEPYLMTLANAAEVASDVPPVDQQGATPTIPSTSTGRRKRTAAAGSALPEPDSVWVQIWQEVSVGLQDLGEVDDQVGGLLVGESIDLFYKRAETFFYTRSLNRLHASLVSENRPAKCLILAILGIVAASRIPGLSPDIQTLARRLAAQFLGSAQRDFAISLKHSEKIVDAIQAAVLISQVYYAQGKVTEGWLLTSQALRLATLAGMHTLKIEYAMEQVLGMGNEGPQLVMRTQKKPMLFNQLVPRSPILAPPEDTAELGERIHLFWACLLVERTGCLALGCLSSINDEDILTTWPRSIFDYTHVTTSKVPDETVSSFWFSDDKQGEEIEEKPKDFWFTTTLKAMSLLHAAQRFYDRSVTEPELDQSTQRQQLLETLDKFSNDVPVECVQLPPVIKKRLLEREVIWVGSAIHAARTLVRIADGGLEHLSEMVDECEFVVRLSKSMSVPERPKLDTPIIVLWHLTFQHLRGVGELGWSHGRINETKKANDLMDSLAESIRMMARVSPLAQGYVHALDREQ